MWPEATQKAFVDYVKNGGGLVVYHFACAAFPQWKEYNEIIGLGGWGGRNEKAGPYVRWKDGKFVRDESPGKGGGHGPSQPFQLVIREPNHPITQGLPEKFMHVSDELYGWLRGPANDLTVLATAFAPKELGGAGEHEPLLFTVGYGKGRVVQVAPGPHAEGTPERGLHRLVPARHRMGGDGEGHPDAALRLPVAGPGERASVVEHSSVDVRSQVPAWERRTNLGIRAS